MWVACQTRLSEVSQAFMHTLARDDNEIDNTKWLGKFCRRIPAKFFRTAFWEEPFLCKDRAPKDPEIVSFKRQRSRDGAGDREHFHRVKVTLSLTNSAVAKLNPPTR